MDAIALRREFHKYPEVGFTEFRTASKVVEILKSLGYEVIYGAAALDPQSRRGVPSEEELEAAYNRALAGGANPKIIEKMKGGNTAVIGILKGKRTGPTVAFRFDMDALPIQESTDLDHFPQSSEFRSKYEGNMHACAHDAHTAIGLSLAEKMSDQNFSGTLKLIFQPAEEGGRGAYSIVKKGMADDIDQLFCLHLGLDVPLGEIYGGSKDLLATTKLLAHFHGVPSHSGISPEKGRNALLGAATALLNIHSLPRFSSCPTRVNVGVLEGGTAPNIIPQYAKMIIETRASLAEINNELEKRVRDIIEHSAAMHGLRYEIEVIGEATTLVCDENMIATVLEQAKNTRGFDSFKEYYNFGGSEDASFLIRRVQECGGQGTYMVIGTPIAAPHHHQKFDIGEDAIPMSVELLERIAKRTLHVREG
ncbi:amidohydrolase [Fodinisporobacter ferrooxydans]|uniref:Amidohydrolase n=1 Tax=Fodinisporobacter ferrooxydans TaxID=2901836 RepID=A0ABY4CIB5_9BACL|nr:amidohydrolase [Alicyclobacillaceae bacterium MYW30-H2]